MTHDPALQERTDHHQMRATLAEYCHACDRGDEAMMLPLQLPDHFRHTRQPASSPNALLTHA